MTRALESGCELLTQSAPSLWFGTRPLISLGEAMCPAKWWCFPILRHSVQMRKEFICKQVVWGFGPDSHIPWPSSFCLEEGNELGSQQYGNQSPETAEKKIERGPGGHLGPWWPCGSATRPRTADLHNSQTCLKNFSQGLVSSSWEQVLTDPGFLWPTLILLWRQTASLLF